MGAKAKKKTKATENSSALENGNTDYLALDVGAAPGIPTRGGEDKATVLYIGRIPHGFYENEMEAFFQQFGKIKRLMIIRNKKTGKSKHYGFIEFESPEVARVVEECLHNYLVYESLLQVRRVPPELNHPRLWRNMNRFSENVDPVKIERKRQDKGRTLEQQQKVVEGIIKRDQRRRKRIKAAGIDYECPELVGSYAPSAPKKIKFDDE